MKKENIFWGLLLIAMAIILVVSKLGYGPEISIITLILTVLFGAGALSSIFHKEFTGFWFCLAFLGILYDEPLGIEILTPWTILIAAGLLSIGCSLIYRPMKRAKYLGRDAGFSNHHNFKDEDDFVVYDEPDGSTFNFSTSFTGSIKYVNSQNFEAGNIDCRFAGLKVYFDTAVIQNGSAVLNMDVSFSGVELYIPKHWCINNKLHTSLGGVDIRNNPINANGPVLTLNGNVSLGGVTIIYV